MFMSPFEQRLTAPAAEAEPKDSKFKRFNELFPYGTIEEISKNQLPSSALEFFEGMNQRFVHPDDKPPEFNAFYRVNRTDTAGLITYIADKDMVYTDHERKPIRLEKNVFFYEIIDDHLVGKGELQYRPKAKKDDAFKDKPFVGYNGTEDDFLKQGLARKRLFAMGAYSEMEWGQPLYSGDQNKMADGVWQSLVRDGLAEEVPNYTPVRKRYRLLLENLKKETLDL